MKIINCEQGSLDWLNLRLGVATASNFDKIITATGKESATLAKYALELATEKMLIKPEDTFKNSHMIRGNELEPLAIQSYQEISFEIVEKVGFIVSDCGNYGYSPDGLIRDTGLIEVKCPMAKTHMQYLVDNKMPIDYIQQVQGGLFISNREWIDFVSYHPNFKSNKTLFVKRVLRDEDYIEKLKSLLEKTISIRDEILTNLLK